MDDVNDNKLGRAEKEDERGSAYRHGGIGHDRNHRLRHTKHHSVHNLDKPVRDSLFVLTTVFNPWRYRSRADLYWEFVDFCERSGAQLMTAEIVLRDRPFVVTEATNTNHLQLRIYDNGELWQKEAALNALLQRLPLDARYVCWLDADVMLLDNLWCENTLHALQHYPAIQLFKKASNISARNEILDTQIGFAYAYQHGLLTNTDCYNYGKFHPGYGWGFRRETLDELGQFYDAAILGSGDRHAAHSFIGRVEQSYPAEISGGYKESLHLYQERALKYIEKSIGYLDTHLLHGWHGDKLVSRKYNQRWRLLVDHKYDPEFDIKKDTQGLLRFSGNKPMMAQDIRKYFKFRDEDFVPANSSY